MSEAAWAGVLPVPAQAVPGGEDHMKNGCAHCHSADIEAELDIYRCLNCGGCTDMRGNALPRDPTFTAPSFQEARAAGTVQ